MSTSRALWGAERSLLLLAAHLPAFGINPTIACPPGRLADAARGVGVDVVEIEWHPVPVIRRGGSGLRRYSGLGAFRASSASVANALKLRSLLRRREIGAVVSNSMNAHLFVAVGGRLAGARVIWHLRDIVAPGPGRRVLQAGARSVSGVVAISSAVASTIRHSKMRTITNPVATPEPGPAPTWAVESGPVVGFLGRVDARKGLEDLISAAPRLVGASVVVVGEPMWSSQEYLDKLKSMASRVAPGRIRFVGRTDDPGAALAAFDVCVVPSHNEPWGRVAAESLAIGTPVVAARSGGLVEIVKDGEDGILYPPGDAAALADAANRLVADPFARDRMGEAGRSNARRFDPTEHAAAVARYLEEVVGDGL